MNTEERTQKKENLWKRLPPLSAMATAYFI